MAETSAASSPAEDVFKGEQPTLAEYQQYRLNGELPERFKPAEEAITDAPEETVEESAGDEPETGLDSEPEEDQEPLPKGTPAQKRILQLLAEKRELQRQIDAARPEPKQPAPIPQPENRTKPTVEAKNPDGTPKYAAYEDYIEDLTEWKAEQQLAKFKFEQAEQTALKALQVKLDDARSRYEDADSIIFPTAQKIKDAQIPQVLKQVIADSDFFPDLCYVIGQDPNELNKLISLAQKNPRAALAVAFEYERGIREELSGEPESKAPEPQVTKAPKPPSPVSGGASKAFDVSDESLSAEEWAKKRNKQLALRRG